MCKKRKRAEIIDDQDKFTALLAKTTPSARGTNITRTIRSCPDACDSLEAGRVYIDANVATLRGKFTKSPRAASGAISAKLASLAKILAGLQALRAQSGGFRGERNHPKARTHGARGDGNCTQPSSTSEWATAR